MNEMLISKNNFDPTTHKPPRFDIYGRLVYFLKFNKKINRKKRALIPK